MSPPLVQCRATHPTRDSFHRPIATNKATHTTPHRSMNTSSTRVILHRITQEQRQRVNSLPLTLQHHRLHHGDYVLLNPPMVQYNQDQISILMSMSSNKGKSQCVPPPPPPPHPILRLSFEPALPAVRISRKLVSSCSRLPELACQFSTYFFHGGTIRSAQTISSFKKGRDTLCSECHL